MKVSVNIRDVDYEQTPPVIVGMLKCRDVNRDLTDKTAFAAVNRSGVWKVQDFFRGLPPPPEEGEQKWLISMIEIGVCDPLQLGDELIAVDERSQRPTT